MALDNLISISFTEAELQQITTAIAQLDAVLQGKAINLTPEERQQYGSIADRNKILVDKCKYYMEQAPDTLPPTVNKPEFDADYIARQQLENPIRLLNRVVEKMMDTKILLDHDNFTNSIAYYRYVKYLSQQNHAGSTSIYEDLRQHYQNSGNTSGTTPPADENTTTGTNEPTDGEV